jgi:hypothetical protein
VQFSVRRKKQVALQKLAHFSPVDANIVLRAESLGIREIKLEGLLKEFGEANVRAQIKVLEMRAADSKLTLIDNSYSYLRSLLRNGLPEENEQKTQTLPSKDFASKNIKNVAQSTDTESADAKFKEQRIALIKQQVAALPLPQREEWMQKAIEKLRVRQQYSGVVQRRAAQGDWSHGLLGAIVVQLYAEHVYGKNWQDQSLDNLKAISPGSNSIDKISRTVVNDDV